MKNKPNILIFNPDQMRADALAHLGNPASITPNLDQLAETEGVSFRNAFCQNPVCVPSRCSFTTGLYPHVNGHRTMSYLLRPGETSLFEELKNAGYYVWMNARNDLVSGKYADLIFSHATELFCGNGTANPQPPVIRPEPGSKYDYSFFRGEIGLNWDGKNVTQDDEDVAAAAQFIREAKGSQPFCLFVGLVNPHPPYQVEQPYFGAIDRGKLPARIRPEDCTGRPRMEELIRNNQGMEAYTEQDWDELRATYLGMCMKVDDLFGQLIQALKDAGTYENTAIFVLSDHGDYTGDYGISEKAQNTFPDCLTNVPLLVKLPKDFDVDPGVTDSLAELVDFYATVMDVAGVTPSHSHFGKSLLPVVADRTSTVRDFVTCEGGRLPGEEHCDEFHSKQNSDGSWGTSPQTPYWPRQYAQLDPDAHAKGYMLRTRNEKYVMRINGADEYYDLVADPRETVNRIDDPNCQGSVIALKMKMLRWLGTTSDVVPFDYDPRFSPEITWKRVKEMVPEENAEEIRTAIMTGKLNHFAAVPYCRSHFN